MKPDLAAFPFQIPPSQCCFAAKKWSSRFFLHTVICNTHTSLAHLLPVHGLRAVYNDVQYHASWRKGGCNAWKPLRSIPSGSPPILTFGVKLTATARETGALLYVQTKQLMNRLLERKMFASRGASVPLSLSLSAVKYCWRPASVFTTLQYIYLYWLI